MGWASVDAYVSAPFVAPGSATIHAHGSATVEAHDSATVWVYGSATVEAYGSATVHAYDSATIHAHGSATVRAHDSATVRAYDSATVWVYDSATVHAHDSATVRAHDSATVEAAKYVAVHLHSPRATITGGTLIDLTTVDHTNLTQWIDYTGCDTHNDNLVLYKAVRDNYKSARGFAYPLGETVTCPDWTDDNERGGGLHLSPHPHQARHYDPSATRVLVCHVAREDARPIPGEVAKVKARRVRVVREVTS